MDKSTVILAVSNVGDLIRRIEERRLYEDYHYKELDDAKIMAEMLNAYICYIANVDDDLEYNEICHLSDELQEFVTTVEIIQKSTEEPKTSAQMP